MKRNMYWILKDGEPVETTMETWANWYNDPRQSIVAQTQIDAEVRVSTVFLGLDHNWRTKGPPILFETMAFGGSLDMEQERYATLKEAQEGHKRMVARVLDAAGIIDAEIVDDPKLLKSGKDGDT